MDEKSNGSQKNIPLTSDEYVTISESTEFKALVKRKNNFILPVTIFFMLFYFALPLLTSFTKILHQKAYADITWVWIFALAQFVMVWTLVTIYARKASSYDKEAEVIIEKAKDGGYK